MHGGRLLLANSEKNGGGKVEVCFPLDNDCFRKANLEAMKAKAGRADTENPMPQKIKEKEKTKGKTRAASP